MRQVPIDSCYCTETIEPYCELILFIKFCLGGVRVIVSLLDVTYTHVLTSTLTHTQGCDSYLSLPLSINKSSVILHHVDPHVSVAFCFYPTVPPWLTFCKSFSHHNLINSYPCITEKMMTILGEVISDSSEITMFFHLQNRCWASQCSEIHAKPHT